MRGLVLVLGLMIGLGSCAEDAIAPGSDGPTDAGSGDDGRVWNTPGTSSGDARLGTNPGNNLNGGSSGQAGQGQGDAGQGGTGGGAAAKK